MHQILKVEIFQPFAQFRNPFTFFYAQTFPLPPKSQIIGMLQNLTRDYYNSDYFSKIKVAVFGAHESIFWNYSQMIKGVPQLGAERKGRRIVDNAIKLRGGNDAQPLYGSAKKSQRTPVYQQEIYNLRLILFFKCQDEELLKNIYDSFKIMQKVMHLGRSEDILFLRGEPELIELEEKNLKDFKLDYGHYILQSESSSISNIEQLPVYNIPLSSKFLLNGQPVQSQRQVLNNKNDLKREVHFQTVYYIQGTSLVFTEKQKVSLCRKAVNETFYLTEQSWL